MERKTLFVDVLLPLSLEGAFTYRVPYDMNDDVAIGKRVVVQFGKKRIYTALIYKIHQNAPTQYSVKYILAVLDIEPIVVSQQFKLWEWMSHYYCAAMGEVMNAALPNAFKLAGESKIVLNPDYELDTTELNDKEFLIVEALTIHNVLALTEVSKILEQIKIIPIVKNLIDKNVILLEEELIEKYKPKLETFVVLNLKYTDEDELILLYDYLDKKAPKQLQIILAHQLLTKPFGSLFFPVKKADLLQKSGCSQGVLDGMIKKGIFELQKKEVSRLEEYEKPLADILQLTPEQDIAYNTIKEGFNTHDTVLLHGVTSSGKTEIYVKLIQEYINKGQQVLFLMPEIGLTTQMINRLRLFFGNDIGVYHSKFNNNERAEIWHAVLNKNNTHIKPYKIILGARSALFLPYDNLGLIIIDEEHELSYKQAVPPRYNARDTALYLRQLHSCKALLGSATPSVETLFNCDLGRFIKVKLEKRYGNLPMPQIQIVDLKDLQKKRMLKSFFSPLLLNGIEKCLAQGEQVILFQNRRGFALWLECTKCSHIPMCKYCDVTLTYHKKNNHLRCHYCGYHIPIPATCPACASADIKMKSYGTERIEDELKLFFPNALIGRMDYDTTREKHAFQYIMNDFDEKKIQILVGTQMISKGLDFNNVGLVGILNADNMLHFPDFRSFERAYQMLTQVCGRTGRKNAIGHVILQTYSSNHFVINAVLENNFDDFYLSILSDRRTFYYPPFCRLINFSLKHRNSDTLNKAADFFARHLRLFWPKKVLGPEFPHVSKVKNEFIKTILLKVDKNLSINDTRAKLKNLADKMSQHKDFKSVKVVIDVDPI